MSVGYNLAGIKSPMVDKFINTMRSASQSPMWDECKQWCLDHVDEFEHIDADYINSISDELAKQSHCPQCTVARLKKSNPFVLPNQ